MKIKVTQQDIQMASQTKDLDPIAHALERTLGGKWQIFEGTTASETIPPYRHTFLPDHVFNHWLLYEIAGNMQPFDFDLRLPEPRS